MAEKKDTALSRGRAGAGGQINVRSLMTSSPRTCTPATNLAEAGALMLDADCGILPVVDDDGKLVGVVTDRDMCIALATRNTLASQLTVGQVAHSPVFTCGPDDDVQSALATMKQHHIRRLPVEGFGGTVAGIISMNDILLAAGKKGVGNSDVIDTFQTICAHHRPMARVTAA